MPDGAFLCNAAADAVAGAAAERGQLDAHLVGEFNKGVEEWHLIVDRVCYVYNEWIKSAPAVTRSPPDPVPQHAKKARFSLGALLKHSKHRYTAVILGKIVCKAYLGFCGKDRRMVRKFLESECPSENFCCHHSHKMRVDTISSKFKCVTCKSNITDARALRARCKGACPTRRQDSSSGVESIELVHEGPTVSGLVPSSAQAVITGDRPSLNAEQAQMGLGMSTRRLGVARQAYRWDDMDASPISEPELE